MKKLGVIAFLFILQSLLYGQNSPTDINYLRIQWENPTGSAPITHFDIHRFETADSSSAIIESITDYLYNSSNNYNAYFSSLPKDTDLFFRIKSINSSGESPYSDATTGRIDSGFDCDTSSVTAISANIVWTSKFPGETTRRWIKLCSSPSDLLSTNENRYRDGGSSASSQVSVSLTGLADNTLYYYFAFEINADGDCVSSDSCSFRTPQAEEPEDPDLHEPNNTSGEATPLTIGSWMDGCYIYPIGDLDFFSLIIADHTHTYNVGLANNTSFTLRLGIYNSSLEQDTVRYIPAGSTYNSTEVFSPESNETYYFRLSSSENASHLESFSLIVSYANEDSYEPNNRFSQATQTSPDLPYTAYIQSTGDEDFYRFNAHAGEYISLDLNTNTTFDLSTELYLHPDTSNQSSRLWWGTSASGTLQMEYTVPFAAYSTFYLKIQDETGTHSDDLNSYTFTLSVPDNPQNIDSDEYNDHFSEATSIDTGAVISGYMIFPGDKDIYEVYTYDNDSIRITLQSTPLPLRLTIFNSQQDSVFSQSGLSSGGMMNYRISGNHFYLKADNTNGDTDISTPYQLIIASLSDSPDDDDKGTIGVDDNYYRKGTSEKTGIAFLGLGEGYSVQILALDLQKIIKIPYNAGGTYWNLKNDNGKEVASGIYYYIVYDENNKSVADGKLIYIK